MILFSMVNLIKSLKYIIFTAVIGAGFSMGPRSDKFFVTRSATAPKVGGKTFIEQNLLPVNDQADGDSLNSFLEACIENEEFTHIALELQVFARKKSFPVTLDSCKRYLAHWLEKPVKENSRNLATRYNIQTYDPCFILDFATREMTIADLNKQHDIEYIKKLKFDQISSIMQVLWVSVRSNLDGLMNDMITYGKQRGIPFLTASSAEHPHATESKGAYPPDYTLYHVLRAAIMEDAGINKRSADKALKAILEPDELELVNLHKANETSQYIIGKMVNANLKNFRKHKSESAKQSDASPST